MSRPSLTPALLAALELLRTRNHSFKALPPTVTGVQARALCKLGLLRCHEAKVYERSGADSVALGKRNVRTYRITKLGVAALDVAERQAAYRAQFAADAGIVE